MTVTPRRRKTLVIVVAASVALFVVGLVIDALPSPDTHDQYWALFVAPSMIAFIVGVVAVLLLLWSYAPQRR